jgi:hypothetical protein
MTLASSANQLTFMTVAAVGGNLIDVNAPSLGKQFVGTTFINEGTLASAIGNNVGANGTTVFSLGSTSLAATLTGNFAGLSSIYYVPVATACTATAPGGSTVATISGSTATLTFTEPVGLGNICFVAGGTTVLGANLTGVQTSGTVGSATATSAALAAYTYNGVVQQLLFSGSVPGYGFDVRIVNNTAAPVSIIAVVQGDNGTTSSAQLGQVPASTNVLYPGSAIGTAAGVTGTSSLLMLAPGVGCVNNANGPSCPVSFSSLLVNPSGDITQLGSGDAP